MVTLGSRRLHMIFADSRGKDLKHRIRRLNTTGELVEVQIYEGATLQDLVEAAREYLPKHLFDVLYLAGGVCDITSKDHMSKNITYDWKSSKDLKIQLIGTLLTADKDFTNNFPASRIVYCPLIGVDLQKVVTQQHVNPEDQQAVNEAVWEFNIAVFDLNSQRNNFSPSLHHQVHRVCKGKKRNYYQHLPDGIHISELLKEKWALQFVKAMAHN